MAKYRPGNEPENIKKRLKTLFDKLDTWYPDKVVIGLNSDHKKAGETVTELYRLLEYPDGPSFLNAYGYEYAQKAKTGRPKGITPQEAARRGVTLLLRRICLRRIRTFPIKRLTIRRRMLSACL